MLHNFINPGPPVITAVRHTDDGYSLGTVARVLCVVDGYAAEITHSIRVRNQEQNSHILSVFDPRDMLWQEILRWEFADGGQIPLHPEEETVARLTEVSQAMWQQASIIAAQSRMRQSELDVQQYVAQQMALQEAQMAAFRAESAAVNDALAPVNESEVGA